MACTVSAPTLKTRCCCVPFQGSEPFCNFRLRSPTPLPRTLPLPLYFHHSCICLSVSRWPSLVSPTAVSVVPHYNDDVTFMPVSCSGCALKICILACCTSVWSPSAMKSMFQRKRSWGIGPTKNEGKRAMLAQGLWGLHCSVSVVIAVGVSVLLFIFWCFIQNYKRPGFELKGIWNHLSFSCTEYSYLGQISYYLASYEHIRSNTLPLGEDRHIFIRDLSFFFESVTSFTRPLLHHSNSCTS